MAKIRLAKRLCAAFLSLVVAEGIAYTYTRIVPDIYKDFTVSSCAISDKRGEGTLVAIGKRETSFLQRTFAASKENIKEQGLQCPTSDNLQKTCDFTTTGQYIPFLGLAPTIIEAKCREATKDELEQISNAKKNETVNTGMIWGMMNTQNP
ncbi:MAG TPA: hypothetical protein PLK94_06635 [Alphaproteobacteria bacterium]|nr:hypothetical protein [Alphaproteobacteria bacterium]HOO50946.1 hypothetical protein [Alphaproteobacteria bacterium]